MSAKNENDLDCSIDFALDHARFREVGHPSQNSLAGASVKFSQVETNAEWVLVEKDLFLQLEHQIAKYDHVASRLPEKLSIANKAKRAYTDADLHVRQIQAAAKEAHKRLNRMEKSAVKKLFAHDLRERKIVERTRIVQNYEEILKAAISAASKEEERLKIADAKKQNCEDASRHKSDVRRRQEEILAALFSAMRGDEAIDAAEQSVRELQCLHVQISHALRDQRQALGCMCRAVECIDILLRILQAAQTASAAALTENHSRIGFVAGVTTKVNMSDARSLGKESQQLVAEARRLSQSMPASMDADAGISPLLAFTKTALDKAFTDVVEAHILHWQIQAVEEAHAEATQCCSWLSSLVDRVEHDLCRNAEALHTAQSELFLQRRRFIMENEKDGDESFQQSAEPKEVPTR